MEKEFNLLMNIINSYTMVKILPVVPTDFNVRFKINYGK